MQLHTINRDRMARVPAAGAVSRVMIGVLIGLAPMATQPAHAQCTPPQIIRLIASDAGPSDNFGWSAAMWGDTALIGSILDDIPGVGANVGSAYVFVRSGPPGSDVWTQQAKLTAFDLEADVAWFGQSVAISGDTAVIGATMTDLPGAAAAGAAFVFVRNGSFWTQQARLTASDAATLDDFGISVAVSGDTAIVGAHLDDHEGGASAGSAYVFVRSGPPGSEIWTQQAKLTASDAATSDLFGFSVALSGDTALIGAYDDDLTPGSTAGSAYVFVRNGTTWTQQARLVSSDLAASDQFGWSVALAGDTAVIGAHVDSHPGQSFAGSAYVFTRSGALWAQRAKLTASDAGGNDRFGQSVAVSGDTVAVGAWWDDHAGGTDSGSTYVFIKPSTGWSDTTETAKLTASDAAASDFFGHAVAVAGDNVIAGANRDNHPLGPADAGSAYVFSLTGCKSQPCAGDLDGGGAVDGIDLAVLLGQWTGASEYAPCPPHRPADLNHDCKVNGLDLAMLLGGWGGCP